MKIENITGCICDSLTIDGKETIDMSLEDIKEAIKKLVDYTNDLGTLQSVIMEIVETEGDYEDLGHCEECGDYISKYTLEI